MRRILLIVPRLLKCGGVANYYNAILPYLRNSKKFKIDVLEVGSYNYQFNILDAIRYFFYDQYRFFKIIHKENYDIIHINPSLDVKNFIRDSLFVGLAKHKEILVITFFRGWVKSFERFVDNHFRKVFGHIYGLSEILIVLSAEEKDKLRQWGIQKPTYIETTVVSDDLVEQFDINRKIELLKNVEVYKILFISRVEKTKGVFELIEAIKLLLHKGYKVSLTIAGEGRSLQEIKRIVKADDKLNRCVEIIGFISGKDKAKALLSHHIFCLPSYSEGFPNALLEAMASGLMPVVSSVGGIKDFLKDKDTAFLITKVIPEDIFSALSKAIDLPLEQKKDIIRCNFELIKQECIASRVSDRLLDMYSSLLI